MMTHVHKMMLVPSTMTPSSYETPLRPMTNETPEKAFTRRSITVLNADMQNILQNDNLSENEKLKLYSQSLQRRLNFQNQLATVAPVPVKIENPSSNMVSLTSDLDKMGQTIISSIPVSLQSKAQRIVEAPKTRTDVITWNKDWQLMYNGNAVPGTNVIDLVDDLVRAKKNFNPAGVPIFFQSLKEINLPHIYSGNDTQRSQLLTQEKFQSPGDQTPH